ncbi:TPR repeat-containing protein (plasmid) [Rhizobium sp. CCGE 510]|nr:TPR repeat-containing protein [Rhizobium sp. CCGE 510]
MSDPALLIALYKHAGRPAGLQRVMTRMRALEPDVHIGRLLDSNYPATTLRRIRLIEAISN